MTAASTFPLANRFCILLYVLVLSAVGTFANTESDFTPLFLSAVGAIIAWLLTDSPHVRAWTEARSTGTLDALVRTFLLSAPKIIPNVAVLVAALRLAWRVYLYINGTQSLIVGLSGFIVALLLCKLFEPKSVRNITQIMILSLLLVVSATMFSNSSLFYFVLLGVYFFLLLYLVVLLNLLAETERLAKAVPANVPGNGQRNTRNAMGRTAPLARLSRDLGAVAKHCAFLVLPVTIMVFLLIPRSRGNPFLSSWGVGAYQTGFSETVQFHDFGELSQSDTPVMTVKLMRDNQEVGSEYSDLYFRGQVLNEYDDRRSVWSHGSGGRGGASPDLSNGVPPPDPWASGAGVMVTYSLLVSSGRTLFLLAPSAPIGEWEPYTYNSNDMTLQDNFSRSRGQTLTYRAIWMPQSLKKTNEDIYISPPGLLRPPRERRDPDGNTRILPQVLVAPELTAKAREILVASMGSGAPPPGTRIPPDQILTVVHIFESYLRVNYSYSLTFHRKDPALDYTTDFLLNHGIKGDNAGGHCEYFASAMVMLCRAVGLNARMVTGYHGGEYNTVNHEFTIRQKYAHAWAEVNVPEEGWVLSDPSPIGSNLDTAAASGHLFKDLFQILQSIWSAAIVNFDNDSRKAIANWFAAEFGTVKGVFSIPVWTSLLAAAFILLIFFVVYLRRRVRGRKLLPENASDLPHRQGRPFSHLSFLEDLLHFFERGGGGGVTERRLRRPDQTPLEYLQPHCVKLAPSVAQDVRWLIDTAYGVRFGDTPLNPALKHRIALALKNVKSATHAPIARAVHH